MYTDKDLADYIDARKTLLERYSLWEKHAVKLNSKVGQILQAIVAAFDHRSSARFYIDDDTDDICYSAAKILEDEVTGYHLTDKVDMKTLSRDYCVAFPRSFLFQTADEIHAIVTAEIEELNHERQRQQRKRNAKKEETLRIKAEALAKLTAKEKAVLGLKG